MRFPEAFRWGCATSSFQNEGDNTNSDWWLWEQGAGHIAGGQRSGLACDWWGDGFTADLDWMSRLHQNAHRLSLEWSRIEPEPGRFDSAALDHYRFMLRSLRERGIEPMVTLHHFSSPLWFVQQGGWERENAAPCFARFVAYTVTALADLCDLWVTVNEPAIQAVLGWLQSRPDESRHQTTFPPGKHDLRLTLRVLQNLLHGHAAAYHAIHRVQPAARAGIAHHLQVLDPRRPDSRLDGMVLRGQDRILNQGVLEAVLHGRVPRVMGWAAAPALRDTVDFLGINYYSRELVAFDIRSPATWFGRRLHDPQAEISDRHFSEVYPEGLFRVLQRVAAAGKPIFITENGVPDADDDLRPSFLRRHLAQLHRAIAAGVDVRGYYHWTLTDNFEWAEGWNLRFGLIALDVATQRRTLRPSGELYGEICRTNQLAG